MLKTLQARDRAKTFDPANAVDSSFIHELKKTGFIDAAWKSKRVSCCRDKISNPWPLDFAKNRDHSRDR